MVEIIFQEESPIDTGLYNRAAESTAGITRDNPKSGVAAGTKLTGNTGMAVSPGKGSEAGGSPEQSIRQPVRMIIRKWGKVKIITSG